MGGSAGRGFWITIIGLLFVTDRTDSVSGSLRYDYRHVLRIHMWIEGLRFQMDE